MKTSLIIITLTSSCLLLADNSPSMPKAQVQASNQNQVDTFSLNLLNQAKEAQKKINHKQLSTDLQSIIDSKKTTEKLKLQAISEMTKQQSDLEAKKASSPEALKQLEDRRKALVTRFNELDRLITQIDKNQKTDLLPEKLTALIIFLEPPPESIKKESQPQSPTKTLTRGSAPSQIKSQKNDRSPL